MNGMNRKESIVRRGMGVVGERMTGGVSDRNLLRIDEGILEI